MRKLGLSPQRPLYRAYQQSPEAVARWKAETYPQLRREAAQVGATIYFADEAGVRSDYHAGTTWVPVGHTPVVAATGDRFAVNLISAVTAKGPVRIGQGWGAPRDGGRRRHQGIDLLAGAGTPLVAVASGHIGRLSNQDRGRGGISLWLRDRRGTTYYYAHNQRNLVRLGQRVRAGQLLARVGATGNARGGPPHLHFQIHPNGGPPASPDAVVRRWCR